SLSGGEAQRVRLATQVGSQLVGVLYILDEPSIGLHQKDNLKLIDSLKKLRDSGNSVIVVEHDKEMIMSSDHIIDLGPFAGVNGGDIIYEGSPDNIKKAKTITADYLNEVKKIEIPKKIRSGNGNNIKLYGCKGNNLKNINVEFPLGKMIAVTGVSGSGKSSLINETLYPILNSKIYNSVKSPLEFKKIDGVEHVDKVVEVNQQQIGRTPRSNPATYTGVYSEIRKLFSDTVEAKIRGWSNGSTTNPLTVTLNSNTTITANFQAIVNSYTLSVTPGEGGSVSSEGGEYEEGTEVTFTATPDEGYGFIGWNGSDSTSSTITVTLNANTTIEPIFRLFPQFTFPETPSKMFTKGVGDTLSIGFSHPGGYKSTSLSAEFGSVSVISEPAEGDTDGNIIIEYTVNTVENVDRMTTIAGFDDIEINISGNDDLENSSTYQIRSQPEPVFKDYLKSSHDLVNSRVAINPGLIRFINEKDNS
ncbi:hypothetical protein OAW53_02950, partial [Flavobacteriaceae bacterium]|nr:hypothetical protein [Flavobacteriaceae bacterium]